MDFPIDQIATTMETLMDNWEMLPGYILAAVAGFDKVALIVIKTLSNIRDAWRENFGNNKI